MPRATIGGQLSINTRAATQALQQARLDAQRTAAQMASIRAPGLAQVEKSLKGTQKASTNSGMGMLMLAQTMDDAQYGIKGVVNNIAPLVTSLGGSMGLAGALTIATIGINSGINAWDKWLGSSVTAKYATQALEEHVQRLAKAYHKAQEAGRAHAEFLKETGELESAGRSSQDRMLQREQRLLELKKDQTLANAEFEDSQKRIRDGIEVMHTYEMQAAKVQAATTKERLEDDRAKLVKTREEISDAEEELEAIDKLRSHKAAMGEALSPADDQRSGYLKEAMEGLVKRRKDLEKRAGELFHDLEDLNQKIETELPAKRQADLTRESAQSAEKAINSAVESLIGMLDSAEGAADEALKAAKRIKEKNKKEALAKVDRTEAEADLEIETAKARGQVKLAARLSKEKEVREDQRKYKKMGFGDHEAEAMARDRQRNEADTERRNRLGHGRIHGGRASNKPYTMDDALDGPSALIHDGPRRAGAESNIYGFQSAVTQERNPARERIANLKKESTSRREQQAHEGGQLARLDEIAAELKRLNQQVSRGSMADGR